MVPTCKNVAPYSPTFLNVGTMVNASQASCDPSSRKGQIKSNDLCSKPQWLRAQSDRRKGMKYKSLACPQMAADQNMDQRV